MVENPEAIEEAIEWLQKNRLVLKVNKNIPDFLSCEIWFAKNKKKIMAKTALHHHQPGEKIGK